LARRQAGRLAHCPNPATAFAGEIRATDFCQPSRKKGWQVPVSPARENERGCQGRHVPAGLSRAARLWRHQPADGWAWFQGRHAFGQGFKGCSPWSWIRKDGRPYGAVQPPDGSGVQGTASESTWRGTSLAMYNLAIQPFLPLGGAGPILSNGIKRVTQNSASFS
jgi:hypothetical protein